MGIESRIPPQTTVNNITCNADLSKGPFFIDGADTIVKLFKERCKELSGKTAHREKDYGIWLSYTWTEFWDNARLIGLGLHAL